MYVILKDKNTSTPTHTPYQGAPLPNASPPAGEGRFSILREQMKLQEFTMGAPLMDLKHHRKNLQYITNI